MLYNIYDVYVIKVMSKFEVWVTRTNTAESIYRVEARSLEEAEVKAEQAAADDDWTGRSHCVEYEIGLASEILKNPEEGKSPDQLNEEVDKAYLIS